MHVAFAVCSLLFAWKWADWKNWKAYHATLLYLISMALLYEFFTRDNGLWRFHPDLLQKETWVVILHTFITMPANVFVFLSRFPSEGIRKIMRYGVWIGIYVGAEMLLLWDKKISYYNGWSLLMSFVFDCIMFPMLRLHSKRPLLAYGLSIPIIAGYLLGFRVPLA